jgi:tetratricopeptide (TPR) repeat protein
MARPDSAAAGPAGGARPRLQRMEALFHAASHLARVQRRDFVERSCVDDAALGEEVLGLLEAESALGQMKASPATAEAADDRWSGRVLGGFRLERLLGQGGMGVVYLAQRSGGDLSQRAAVKLMAYHLQSTPAQAQFLAERQALAELEHPNITRLLDGGVTPEGLPYLVMEYVEGRRLDVVCDAAGTTLETIARLTMQLCDAVGYVHRNLILHRDLKPGNVMVTEEGSVKLLDFGTLKGLGARFAGDSAMTQAGMRSLTLRYASPEQIRGEPPSTAMDVYSLGMILYRLVAGSLPEAWDELSIPEHLAMLEREEFGTASRSGPAWRQKADPVLAADLDAIALKAIRFRASERYEGADALAADLRRALERWPVLARAGTVRYRAGLFVRRNRTLTIGTAIALLVLGLGVAAMAHEAGVARDQSRRADAGVEEERRLTHLLLFDYFAQLKQIPSSTDAQRKAVSQAMTYLNTLSAKDMTPGLQLEIIQAYTELGNLQGSQYEENLGDVAGAIRSLRLAVSLADRLAAQQPTNIAYVRSQALARRSLGAVYQSMNDAAEAIPALAKALALYRSIAARNGSQPDDLVLAASCADMLGDSYGLPGAGTLMDPEKAIRGYQESQRMDKEAVRLDPTCIRCLRGVAIEDWKLGQVLGFTDEAANYYRDGLTIFAAFPPAAKTATSNRRLEALLQQNLGLLYADTGRVEEGLALVETVRSQMRDAIAADPLDARARMDLALLDDDVAYIDEELHRYRDEMAPRREFLAMMEAMVRTDPANSLKQFRRGKALALLGRLELQLGQKEEARRHGVEAIAVLVPLARESSANPRILDVTSDALVDFHPNESEDAALAVELSQRAVKITPKPGVEQYLALAEAQRFAGMGEQSVVSAKNAQQLMVVHPKSLSDAVQVEELKKLVENGE